ncbi:TPA: O-antigen ligase family protein, partial [Escherichia coli]|nr:O-antigen ligase family protein [Escherichia coli]
LARTGIAMFGVILFLTILLNAKLNAYKLGRLKKVLLVMGPILICLGLLIAFFDVILLRFTTAQDVSLNIRFYLADIAFNMIENNPLTGVGLNAFTTVMKHYDHTGVSGYFMFPVHNIYLLIASETGLIGLISFLLVMCVFLFSGVRIVRKGRVLLARQLAFCAISGLVVIYLSGLLGWSWRLDCLQVIFYILLGLVAAARKIEGENKNEEYYNHTIHSNK